MSEAPPLAVAEPLPFRLIVTYVCSEVPLHRLRSQGSAQRAVVPTPPFRDPSSPLTPHEPLNPSPPSHRTHP